MKYNELTLTRQKAAHRVGRGISAGRGKTAGRGTKGQGSRKSGVRQGFEGGQMPLYMRLPKLRGFKSRAELTEVVYTGQLDSIKGSTVDSVTLFKNGLVSSPHVNIKLISKGDMSSSKAVNLQGASTGALKILKKAGGSFTITERLARLATKPATTKEK